jgi:hypothetical protein
MKRLALAAALVLMTVFPMSASASITQDNDPTKSCTTQWHDLGDPVPFVCLSESSPHSGYDLRFTGSSDSGDLRDVTHEPSGQCAGTVHPLDNNWNDCISSVWAKLGTNDSVCLYADQFWHQLIWWAAAPSSPSGGVWTYALADFGSNNDRTSAVRLQQSGTDCPYL